MQRSTIKQIQFSKGQALRLRSGQAALVAVIFFLFVSLAIVGGFGLLGASYLQAAGDSLQSKKSYATSESAVEDIMYRIISEKTYALTETVNLNGGSAEISVSVVGGKYTLTSSGNILSRHRRVKAVVVKSEDDGLAFNSSVQAGYIGVDQDGSSVVSHYEVGKLGNIFSNGRIDAGTINDNDKVTGDVTIARPLYAPSAYTPVPDQESMPSGVDPPPATCNPAPSDHQQRLKWTDTNARDGAQSFIPSKTAYVVRIDLCVKRVGNPGQMDLKVVTNEPGDDHPQDTNNAIDVLSRKNYQQAAFSGCVSQFCWFQFELITDYPLIENEKYWIVFDTDKDMPPSSTDYYILASADTSPSDDSTYTNGQGTLYSKDYCHCTKDGPGTFKTSPNAAQASPTWIAKYVDLAFRVYLGDKSTTNYLNKGNGIVSESGTLRGDWLFNSKAAVEAHYRTSTGVTVGTKSCGSTTQPPCYANEDAPEPRPFTAYNVAGTAVTWQEELYYLEQIADAGPDYGATTVQNGATIPLATGVINGNLIVRDNNSRLRIMPNADGRHILWIKGNGTFSQACHVEVTTPEADGFLIFTGTVDANNTCDFIGGPPASGGNGGNIYIVTTYHDADDAGTWVNTMQIRNGVNTTNNTGRAGVWFAPLGAIKIVDQATVTALAAAEVRIANSANVKYNDGVAERANGAGTKGATFAEFHEIE